MRAARGVPRRASSSADSHVSVLPALSCPSVRDLAQAMADLEVAAFLPDILKNLPGWQQARLARATQSASLPALPPLLKCRCPTLRSPQLGDGILDGILVAIQLITQNQLEADYLKKAREAGVGL